MSSRIILTAFELGLFNSLSMDPRTACEIAMDVETDIGATETLLNALVALDILTKQGEYYALKEEVRKCLVPGEADYLGADLAHMCGLWDYWSNLSQIIRTGHPSNQKTKPETRMELALAMKRQASNIAPQIAALFGGVEINTLLDLGGGSGHYSIAFAKRYPNLRAVLYDFDDQALKLAKVDIEDADLQDRIDIRKGNFLVEEIGTNYDLVFISSTLCTLPEEKTLVLLQKVKQALKKGGRIVIRDYMLDDTKTAPVMSALFSVCMLTATSEGRVYSSAELRGWLGNIGFKNVHQIPLSPMSMMIGIKGQNRLSEDSPDQEISSSAD